MRPLSAEVALKARVDPSTVGWLLERFRDAGLVEDVGRDRYRWRPSHRYALQRGEPHTGMRDPVCSMRVGIDARFHAEDIFGRTEYFCSERCMAAFLAWPSAFTRRPVRRHVAHLQGDAMGRDVPLGRRTLLADPRRAAVSVLGVGLAVALMLLIQGLWSGTLSRITAYEEHVGARLFVAELGTRSFLSDVSTEPAPAVDRVREVAGGDG